MPRYQSFFLLILILVSCSKGNQNENGTVLAQVENKYLYSSDLQGVVPPGTSSRDSIEIAKKFILNWINQKLVVKNAEKFLDKADKDFSKELEEYRNSLIVYAYEKALIEQKLDTAVSTNEISDYYSKNQQNFQLKENIVKVLYIKLKLKDPNISKFRSLLKSGDPHEIEKLRSVVKNEAVNFYLDDRNWLFFNDLLKEIPIETYDQEAYLQNHRFIEINDDQFTYLVHFKDFKIKESVSPLILETENIRNIILNKRKMTLISDMEKKVMDEAVKNKDFEIF